MKKGTKPSTKQTRSGAKKKKGVKNRPPANSRKDRKPPKKNVAAERQEELFPVVGIGASAGGIEAISNLLENLPAKLGMAYVIIQHLSPNHESILPELLHRKTSMPVLQAADVMHISQDHIYVIPPNTYMSIEDSILKLSPRIKSDGSYHSIDFFLNSLASAYKNRAIAVILSGIASDGTQGIEAIKAEGGITFAQNETAKFQGMPRSAADSGFVDFILSPAEIAKQLEALPRVIYSFSEKLNGNTPPIKDQHLKKIFFLLQKEKKVDFSQYKPSTINRRILRRMVLNNVPEVEKYLQMLEHNHGELNLLFRDLLINVTGFFRDPALYASLTKKIFPVLLKDRSLADVLRIWIPACSSGEEAYSTAICLFEFLKGRALTTPVQVFATDLSETAIARARTGIYPAEAMSSVSPDRLKKYFIKIDGNYQITKAVRDVCVFATHNVLMDPPFSRMDVISCQNLLIYLEVATQKKVLQGFHYALRPSGFLLLGKSETIGESLDLFTHVGKDQKIYQKKNTKVSASFDFSNRSTYMLQESRESKKILVNQQPDLNIDKETEKILLSRYTPASLLVDKDLLIERFIGNTSPFLQPVSGRASLNLLKMVRDDLIFDIRTLLQKVKNENRPARKEGIIYADRGNTKEISLEVLPIRPSGRDIHYLIIIHDHGSQGPVRKKKKDGSPGKDSRDKRIVSLENQLTEARDHIKMMSEEFEAAREELQSSNEEILSSNEELQSINEEIETSKEELQSANEELTTINDELGRRNNDLKEAVDFSQAILQTIDEPLILLSPDMRIKMANRAFYKDFRTNDGKIDGQVFFEISDHRWNIPLLKQKLNEVFAREKKFDQFELRHLFPVLGERILKVNAILIDKDDAKDCALLVVLEDITHAKTAESQLRDSEERLRLLIKNASDIITILSPEGNILYESESVEAILGYEPSERIGRNIFRDPIAHPDDVSIKEGALKEAIANPNEKIKAEFRLKHKDGSYRDIEGSFVNMVDDPKIRGIVANYHDVTEQRRLERQREEFISIASHELRTPVTSMKGYIQIIKDMFASAEDQFSFDLMNKVDHQVDRLTNLIRDLLDISRIRQGQLEFNEAKFEIDDLLRDTVAEMQLGSKKHLLVTDLDAKKKILADPERIGQVINNLISNAIKFSPGAEKIIIASSSTGEEVTVSVTDFGVGIKPELQKKIFDRFFRLFHGNQGYAGLGLGLYIAAEIVRRHRGKIWVESKPEKGSKFSFSLPLKP